MKLDISGYKCETIENHSHLGTISRVMARECRGRACIYSNCLIECIRAKVHNWGGVSIRMVSPIEVHRINGSWFPHFYWYEDGYKRWFFTFRRLRWYEYPLHRGYVLEERV